MIGYIQNKSECISCDYFSFFGRLPPQAETAGCRHIAALFSF